MSKMKIKVTALQKSDKKSARALEQVINANTDKYHGVISALAAIEVAVPAIYGKNVTVPHNMIERVMIEVVQLEVFNR